MAEPVTPNTTTTTTTTTHDSSNQPTTTVPELNALITRARTLLSELESFRTRLRTLRQEGSVELSHFRGTVTSELNMLLRLADKPDTHTTRQIIRSSNLPFLETVWATAKTSRDVTALQKRIYTSSDIRALAQGMRHVDLRGRRRSGKGTKGSREAAVLVDAITEGGTNWVKVSLVTNARLLFDLAKQGWDSGESEFGSDDEEYEFSAPPRADDEDGDDDRDVPLLKTVKELTKAATLFRARTRTPQVHLVLPRIQEGETAAIDAVLAQCRAEGAVLLCGASSPLPVESASSSLDDSLRLMAPDPVDAFSDVLNIDCTILLALVSEFSHAKVSKEPWFHAALNRQVEIEGNENLLPALLYPALVRRQLVCTKEAVHRMREIVDTIGTESEKARTRIMMGDAAASSQAELTAELQQWSAHEVPADWRLPIKIVDANEGDCQSHLPAEALQVSEKMTSINRSVFLYGWATGSTTITSNRTVVKQLEHDLETFDNLAEEVWPKIWLCPTARSLVGKEKRGAKKEELPDFKKQSAWPLPDPLRREEQRRNGLDVLSLREGHPVEDLRPNGYPCDEVLAAKNAAMY